MICCMTNTYLLFNCFELYVHLYIYCFKLSCPISCYCKTQFVKTITILYVLSSRSVGENSGPTRPSDNI